MGRCGNYDKKLPGSFLEFVPGMYALARAYEQRIDEVVGHGEKDTLDCPMGVQRLDCTDQHIGKLACRHCLASLFKEAAEQFVWCFVEPVNGSEALCHQLSVDQGDIHRFNLP